MKKVSFFKSTTVILIMITAFSKILGFFREVFLAYFYGASNISDAYLVSVNIPVTVFGLFTMGLATSFIPIYNEISHKDGEERGKAFLSNLTNVMVVLCTIIITICMIFTRQIVGFFASGFTEDTLELAVHLTRITIFSIYFIAIFTIFKGMLQIHNYYVITVIGGLILDIIMMCSIALSSYTDYRVLALGVIISYIIQLVILIPAIKKCGYTHNLVVSLKDPYIARMLRLALPVMIGTAVSDINVMIDNILASHASVGSISMLNYASKINSIAQGVFLTSIVTIYFPEVSKSVEAGNQVEIGTKTSNAINNVLLFILPTLAGILALSKEIVEVLFQRGAFDARAVEDTAQCLNCYAVGLVGISIREIISKVFYAQHDSKTPMINGIAAVIINIILNFIFIQVWGTKGLALATSVSITFCAVSLSFSIHRKVSGIWNIKLLSKVGKMAIASLLMAVAARWIYGAISEICGIVVVTLGLTVLAGVLIYFALIGIFLVRLER